MVALGIFGQKCYLGDTWNRLDFFIVMAGSVTKPHKFAVCSESKKTPESQICRLSWLFFIMSCESCQAQAKAKSISLIWFHLWQPCQIMGWGMNVGAKAVGFSVAILSPVSSLSN